MTLKYLLLFLVLATTAMAETFYFGNSCIVSSGNSIDGVQQPISVSGTFQLQGYCGLKNKVTIPCTEENRGCEPNDCQCFGLANNGAASMAGAAATAGVTLMGLLLLL